MAHNCSQNQITTMLKCRLHAQMATLVSANLLAVFGLSFNSAFKLSISTFETIIFWNNVNVTFLIRPCATFRACMRPLPWKSSYKGNCRLFTSIRLVSNSARVLNYPFKCAWVLAINHCSNLNIMSVNIHIANLNCQSSEGVGMQKLRTVNANTR